MRYASIAWLTLVSLVHAGPALALTISNIDAKAHDVTVTAGGKDTKLTIDPKQQAEAACAGGCTVKLDSGEQYQFKGEESVSIEEGAMFIDSSPDAFVEGLPAMDPDNMPDEPEEEENVEDETEDADQAK